jgi:hypothetical protein
MLERAMETEYKEALMKLAMGDDRPDFASLMEEV